MRLYLQTCVKGTTDSVQSGAPDPAVPCHSGGMPNLRTVYTMVRVSTFRMPANLLPWDMRNGKPNVAGPPPHLCPNLAGFGLRIGAKSSLRPTVYKSAVAFSPSFRASLTGQGCQLPPLAVFIKRALRVFGSLRTAFDPSTLQRSRAIPLPRPTPPILENR